VFEETVLSLSGPRWRREARLLDPGEVGTPRPLTPAPFPAPAEEAAEGSGFVTYGPDGAPEAPSVPPEPAPPEAAPPAAAPPPRLHRHPCPTPRRARSSRRRQRRAATPVGGALPVPVQPVDDEYRTSAESLRRRRLPHRRRALPVPIEPVAC
jgi:hypothetical protein